MHQLAKESDKLKHFIIGSDELSQKMTGLLRWQISTVINCSSLAKNPNDKFIKFIKINVDSSEKLSSTTITDDDTKTLSDIFNSSDNDSRHRIMICSDNLNKSRLIYCLIAMKVLKIELVDLVKMFINRSNEYFMNGMLSFDSSNYNKFSTDELKILIELEKEIHGKTSIEQNETKEVPKVPTQTQNDKPINKELLNNETKNVPTENDNPIACDLLNYDMNMFEETDDVRPPSPARMMCLMDDLNPRKRFENPNSKNNSKNNSNDNSTKKSPKKLDRPDDFIRILSVMNGKVDRDLVKEMLNKGMSVEKIIDTLMI